MKLEDSTVSRGSGVFVLGAALASAAEDGSTTGAGATTGADATAGWLSNDEDGCVRLAMGGAGTATAEVTGNEAGDAGTFEFSIWLSFSAFSELGSGRTA